MSLEAQVALTLGRLELEAELVVATGELVVLLGPNGAGKTTLLRALAGLVALGRGRVVLDGEVLEDTAAGTWVPTEARPIGFVFQDYLLFPHLSALENVAFGLRARGLAKAEARKRAAGWLEWVGLAEHAGSRPRALSGGQAQRVALARAMVSDPRLLLLDEPLAALDAATRTEVRRDLRRHLASFDGTRLLVTHDPLEAMALADRLIVLEGGRITQTGNPDDVSAQPRSRYVAELVGVNLYRGRATGPTVQLADGGVLVVAGDHHGEVFAAVHPHAVALHRHRPEGTPR
ncbi:MAG TPA: ABC transporter ATP-binding protein, partial [Actinomycetota bacterium]|nr:ABC transporter ATP-binding protein [Actinomycetota bacterium]